MGKQTQVISGDCLSIHIRDTISTLWPPGLQALVTHPIALQMDFPDGLIEAQSIRQGLKGDSPTSRTNRKWNIYILWCLMSHKNFHNLFLKDSTRF